MKKTIFLVAAIALTGCAVNKTHESAAQNYRLQGAENAIAITGKLDQKRVLDVVTESVFHIYFDGTEQITGSLDRNLGGEFTGMQYNGKPTSAACSSKKTGETTAEVRCMVFIGNERTVTLTF